MSIYKSSSLAMIPTAYKDGKLYSIRPTDGSGDFTFSRGSNLAATRVDVNGLIEKGRENLFVQSNQFDTTWILGGATITGGQSGYDGTNNAWKLQDTAATGEHFVRQTPNVGNIVSVSVYAKANTLNFLWLRSVESGVNKRTWFDLSSGSVGTSQGIDANIESVGNGWYRCSATFNHQTAFEYYIAISDANGSSSYAGTGNGSIYIQDAQLEQGLVATDYIETGASTAQAGILEDMPRLDYSGSASCPSLLLEPQRTNLAPYSELYGTSFINTTATRNNATAPTGYNEATLLEDNNAVGEHLLGHNFGSITNGSTYTISCFFKADGSGGRAVIRYFVGNWIHAVYNLDNGTIANVNGAGTADIENYGNGWYRCILTATAVTDYAPFVTQIGIANSSNQFSYQGTSSLGLYFWGFQAELGSYPTSYIPTYGTSQTRSDDDCNKTGITSLIGQTEGVLFIEFEFNKDIDAAYRISLSDGTSANRIQLGTFGDQIQVYVQTGGATQVYELSGTLSVGTTYKAALAYKANDYVCYLNGSQLFTDTSASVPACSKVGYEIPDGTGLFEHPLKQQVLFKTRLTNAELAALTS